MRIAVVILSLSMRILRAAWAAVIYLFSSPLLIHDKDSYENRIHRKKTATHIPC
jgi:hypothetical protein